MAVLDPPPGTKASFPPRPPPWLFASCRPSDPSTAPVLSVHPRVKRRGGGMPEKFWRGVGDWVDPNPPAKERATEDRSSGRQMATAAPTKEDDKPSTVEAASSDVQTGEEVVKSMSTGRADEGKSIPELSTTDTSSAVVPTPPPILSNPPFSSTSPASPAVTSSTPTPTPLTSDPTASSSSTPPTTSSPAPPPPTNSTLNHSSPIASSSPAPPPPPPAPVVKPPTKSWAALLRPSTSSSSTSSTSSSTTTALKGTSQARSNGTILKAGGKSNLTQLLAKGAQEGELWAGWKEGKRIGPRGLVNRGNLCFVNSILQVLIFTQEFYNLFGLLGELMPSDSAGEYPLLEAMIGFLREFPASASTIPQGGSAAYPSLSTGHVSSSTTPSPSSVSPSTSDEQAFVPEGVYTAMSQIARFDFMRQGRQEDAEEFLGFFLNTLGEETVGLLAKQPVEVREAVLGREAVEGSSSSTMTAESTSANEGSPNADGSSGWVEVGKKGKGSLLRQSGAGESTLTALTRLFTGSYRSTLTIPSHPSIKPSISIEPFSPLQLHIQPSTVFSVETALQHLPDPETINDVVLPSSTSLKGSADATRRTELETLPKVLVLHLKRFGWAEGARKMGKVVAFGEELVVPKEAIAPSRRTARGPRYKLFGVVYHHGPTVSSGHYTSAVLSRSLRPLSSSSTASAAADDQWLHIDDEQVTVVDPADVVISEESARAGVSGEIGGRERCAYLLFYERVE